MSQTQREARLPLGCCLTAGTFMPQGGTAAAAVSESDPAARLAAEVEAIWREGYDFAELTVGSLTALSEEAFARWCAWLRETGRSIPVFNSFIPPAVRLTGPDADPAAIRSYVELAMSRVAASGGEVIVFGSGAARTVPDGYPLEQAMEQIRQFLRLCNELAEGHNLQIAIEPLNRGESNIINTVAEALELADAVNLPRIQVLADAYHMTLEREPFGVILRAAASGRLIHVHYAERDRGFPNGSASEPVDLESLLRALEESGYRGRVSAECMSAAGPNSRKESLAYVRSIWSRIAN